MEYGGRHRVPYDLESAKFRRDDFALGDFVEEGLFKELIQESESSLQAVSDSWKAYDDVQKSGGTCSDVLMCIAFPCCAISKAMVRADDLDILQLSFQSAWMHSERRGNAAIQEKLFEWGCADRIRAVLVIENSELHPCPKSSKVFLTFDEILTPTASVHD